MSFSTEFQSIQDDGRLIMKGCVQWNTTYSWKDFRLELNLNPGLLDQQASASGTELPGPEVIKNCHAQLS